jgi:hypothetical protein
MKCENITLIKQARKNGKNNAGLKKKLELKKTYSATSFPMQHKT